MGYQFFLSYGRVESQREHISEFFDDLSNEVRDQIGRDGDEPGFLDVGVEPGRDWRETIATALRTSKSMVCLVSEDLIGSTYCGREFTAFQRRLESREISVSDSGLIMPVRWTIVNGEMPTVLAPLLDRDRDYPPDYATKGLLRLKRNKRTQYRSVVEKLGDMIVKRTRACMLPPSPPIPSLQETLNAYRPSDVVEGLGPLGPKNAKFVFIVPQPRELPDVKKQRHWYHDEGGYWWYAYQPPNEEPMGRVAEDVAWKVRLPVRATELLASPELPKQVQIAVQSNTSVAVVIDPWSLTVAKYNQIVGSVGRLLSDDHGIRDGCAIFVTFNTADADTVAEDNSLTQYVEAALSKAEAKYVYRRIASVDDFRDKLAAFLEEVRTNLDKEPARAVQGGYQLHTLGVPGESSRP